MSAGGRLIPASPTRVSNCGEPSRSKESEGKYVSAQIGDHISSGCRRCCRLRQRRRRRTGLFTPYIGWNWGGTAGFTDIAGDFEDEFERRANFGASLAWMGAGAVGFEVDFGYAPNFFAETAATRTSIGATAT